MAPFTSLGTTSPLVLTGIVGVASALALSPAPVQAQADPLRELSRQMIGSSFDTTPATSVLPSSPSLVDSANLRREPIVGNLVDQEIRRPSAAKATTRSRGTTSVQLIVPVKTGLEFAQIQQLVPSAKILEMSGGVFVLVTETSRALPAYQKGRDLQARLGVTFQLAYSDNHPDLDLAWMAPMQPDTARVIQPRPATHQAQPVATKTPEPPRPGRANDLGLLEVKASWLNAANPPSTIASAAPAEAAATRPTPQLAKAVAMAPAASVSSAAQPQRTAPAPAAERRASADVTKERPTPQLATTAASVSPAVPEMPVAQQPMVAGSASPIQAVAIRPAVVAQVPIIATRFMAVNQELAYVYVRVRDDAQLAAVSKLAPIAMVHARNGEMLAQVGVFRSTRLGERLRDEQVAQLRRQGFELEVVA